MSSCEKTTADIKVYNPGMTSRSLKGNEAASTYRQALRCRQSRRAAHQCQLLGQLRRPRRGRVELGLLAPSLQGFCSVAVGAKFNDIWKCRAWYPTPREYPVPCGTR